MAVSFVTYTSILATTWKMQLMESNPIEALLRHKYIGNHLYTSYAFFAFQLCVLIQHSYVQIQTYELNSIVLYIGGRYNGLNYK